jgi:2,3-dihydroxybiphenyl 1,2-dioxygenase
MEIEALGYVCARAENLADWPAFGTGLLGMEMVDRGAGSIAFRMDDRRQRLILESGPDVPPRVFGWEVADADALDALAARLDRAGVAVQRGGASLADRRFVADLIAFDDPEGNRVEVFHGARLADAPFRPGRAISGFRTGPLGMGHGVLAVRHVEPMLAFYRDLLKFRLTDYVHHPIRGYFLHVNARHHSLALIETGTSALHHVMVELYMLDDVGQGYDLALKTPDRIAATLGRHTNDFMTSFYARTPSGFMVEYGWGGREIAPDWTAREVTDGTSLWGHDRRFLPDEARAEAARLREDAAARGLRAPVQVLPGAYHRVAGACPWWDATMHRA